MFKSTAHLGKPMTSPLGDVMFPPGLKPRPRGMRFMPPESIKPDTSKSACYWADLATPGLIHGPSGPFLSLLRLPGEDGIRLIARAQRRSALISAAAAHAANELTMREARRAGPSLGPSVSSRNHHTGRKGPVRRRIEPVQLKPSDWNEFVRIKVTMGDIQEEADSRALTAALAEAERLKARLAELKASIKKMKRR